MAANHLAQPRLDPALAAWCETRADFRSFRVDRSTALVVLEERSRDEPGRGLADLFRRCSALPP